MGSQDNLISKEFLLELNRLVGLKELQLELFDNLGAIIMWKLNYAKKYRCAKFGWTSLPSWADIQKTSHPTKVYRYLNPTETLQSRIFCRNDVFHNF
jgi:hypothetical protein